MTVTQNAGASKMLSQFQISEGIGQLKSIKDKTAELAKLLHTVTQHLQDFATDQEKALKLATFEYQQGRCAEPDSDLVSHLRACCHRITDCLSQANATLTFITQTYATYDQAGFTKIIQVKIQLLQLNMQLSQCTSQYVALFDAKSEQYADLESLTADLYQATAQLSTVASAATTLAINVCNTTHQLGLSAATQNPFVFQEKQQPAPPQLARKFNAALLFVNLLSPRIRLRFDATQLQENLRRHAAMAALAPFVRTTSAKSKFMQQTAQMKEEDEQTAAHAKDAQEAKARMDEQYQIQSLALQLKNAICEDEDKDNAAAKALISAHTPTQLNAAMHELNKYQYRVGAGLYPPIYLAVTNLNEETWLALIQNMDSALEEAMHLKSPRTGLTLMHILAQYHATRQDPTKTGVGLSALVNKISQASLEYSLTTFATGPKLIANSLATPLAFVALQAPEHALLVLQRASAEALKPSFCQTTPGGFGCLAIWLRYQPIQVLDTLLSKVGIQTLPLFNLAVIQRKTEKFDGFVKNSTRRFFDIESEKFYECCTKFLYAVSTVAAKEASNASLAELFSVLQPIFDHFLTQLLATKLGLQKLARIIVQIEQLDQNEPIKIFPGAASLFCLYCLFYYAQQTADSPQPLPFAELAKQPGLKNVVSQQLLALPQQMPTKKQEILAMFQRCLDTKDPVYQLFAESGLEKLNRVKARLLHRDFIPSALQPIHDAIDTPCSGDSDEMLEEFKAAAGFKADIGLISAAAEIKMSMMTPPFANESLPPSAPDCGEENECAVVWAQLAIQWDQSSILWGQPRQNRSSGVSGAAERVVILTDEDAEQVCEGAGVIPGVYLGAG